MPKQTFSRMYLERFCSPKPVLSKVLKTSNKRTHIPLFINQFVSLIEQDLAIDKLLN